MPILAITPDELKRRETLAYLEALMLWPDDGARGWRELGEKTGRLQHMEQCMREEAGEMPVRDAAALLRLALESPSLAELRKQAERPYMHGLAAGFILVRLLSGQAGGWNETIDHVKHEIARRFHQRRLQEKTITRIWPLYRPVAHLWAAHLIEYGNERVATFPCRISALPTFLATAERCRLDGEAIRLQRSSGTALRPGETWAAPAELGLEAVDLQFPSAKAD